MITCDGFVLLETSTQHHPPHPPAQNQKSTPNGSSAELGSSRTSQELRSLAAEPSSGVLPGGSEVGGARSLRMESNKAWRVGVYGRDSDGS